MAYIHAVLDSAAFRRPPAFCAVRVRGIPLKLTSAIVASMRRGWPPASSTAASPTRTTSFVSAVSSRFPIAAPIPASIRLSNVHTALFHPKLANNLRIFSGQICSRIFCNQYWASGCSGAITGPRCSSCLKKLGGSFCSSFIVHLLCLEMTFNAIDMDGILLNNRFESDAFKVCTI